MKLKEIVIKEILLKSFCEHLEETTAAIKSVQGKLARLLDDSKDLIFKPFGITAKDPKYFIAGSARLYLYPQLAEILKLKEVGDLDMVVPGRAEWEKVYNYNQQNPNREIKEGELSKGIWRPTADDSIEAFTKWAPNLAKTKDAKDFSVRDTNAILADSIKTPIGGYYFMSLYDIMDYKLNMNRPKEQAITKYLIEFQQASPQERESIKQKVLELFAGDETQARDFLSPAVAQKT